MTLDPDLLDDPGALADGDPTGFLRGLATGGAQVREAAALAADAGVRRLAADGRPRAVVAVGTGTAAAAGELLVALAGVGAPVPLLTSDGSGLPGWVGGLDLVMAASADGRSPAAVLALGDAARRGARVLAVGAPGSPLEAACERARGTYVPVRGRAPERAALWALAVPLLLAADALGLMSLPSGQVEAAAARLEQVAVACRPDADSLVNPAKSLAVSLAGGLPLFWGCSQVTGAVARRAAAQWAASAGSVAVAGALPAVLAEGVGVLDLPRYSSAPLGGEDLDDFFRDRVDDHGEGAPLRPVLLRDPGAESDAVAQAAGRLQVLTGERGIDLVQLTAAGEGRLERAASLVGLLDAAAAYSALILGVDPAASGASAAVTG